MFSGSKKEKKKPDMELFILSKVPINEPPPGSPRRELPVYTTFFTYHSNS